MKPIQLFVSYSKKDEPFRDALETHLKALQIQGAISVWHDRMVAPGEAWAGALDRALEDAEVIVFLVTADLLASEYAHHEMRRALERAEAGDVVVLPVVVRPVDWMLTPLAGLQVLPNDGKPISQWDDFDAAWADVALGIREAIKTLKRTTKVTSLSLKDFTVFENARMDWCPGINVMIGTNGTGKSHVMKLIYSLLKASNEARNRNLQDAKDAGMVAWEKVARVFLPDDGDLGRLVRNSSMKNFAEVALECRDGSLRMGFGYGGDFYLKREADVPAERCVFIPSREALAMYEGFAAAYSARQLSFDETYYDLCLALSAAPLRRKRSPATAELVASLEAILGGNVRLSGDRFYVHQRGGRISAHLYAEGLRKIAALTHLLANGALAQDSILFWDEPEANLNPKLVTLVASVLRTLASQGMQIFVASHDYLLTRELSLAAEYDTGPSVQTHFFAFDRASPEAAVRVEQAPTLAGLDHNPILEELSAHYEREQALFAGPGSSRE